MKFQNLIGCGRKRRPPKVLSEAVEYAADFYYARGIAMGCSNQLDSKLQNYQAALELARQAEDKLWEIIISDSIARVKGE